jgi:hypothetical protein
MATSWNENKAMKAIAESKHLFFLFMADHWLMIVVPGIEPMKQTYKRNVSFMYNNDRWIIINNLGFWLLVFVLSPCSWILVFCSFSLGFCFNFLSLFSLLTNRQATASQILVTMLPVSAQSQHQYYMSV